MENQTEANEVVVAHRAIEIVEIESQIATAKRYPRDIKIFKEKLMSMANLDQETAEGCYYALPRGGKAIDGPSIRLAEIALSCYQNCVAEADVLNEDDRFIYAQGQCRDLENNISVRVKVRRRITNRDGKRFNDDMIAVTANAACAIALRNAIFKIVPGAYLKPVFDKCKKTAVGEVKSLANKRAEVIKRLMQFGVTKERILNVISRKSTDEVTFDDVAILIGLGTAIKDGDTTVEEAFPETFKEAKEKSEENIKAQAGSESIEKPMTKAQKAARTRKANKQKKELAEVEARDKAGPTKFLFACKNCGVGFDKPKIAGSGAKQVAICPHCLSKNIVSTEDEKKSPDFMQEDDAA